MIRNFKLMSEVLVALVFPLPSHKGSEEERI